MKLPQKASFGPETCEIGPKVTIWGIRRTGFPPEDSPSFTEHLSRHRYHFLSNVAIDLNQDEAEVECYGIATSTHDGKILNFFGERYHNSFKKIEQDWLMSRSEYILDYNFTSEVSDLGDAMDQLQSGVGLDMNNKLYRKLHKQ